MLPYLQMGTAGDICHLFRRIIAHPDTCRIIRRISIESQVHIITGGTSFTGNRHSADLCRSTCTAGDNIFHHICQKVCSCFFQNTCTFFFSVIQKYIAIVVIYHCVISRFIVCAAICDTCVCSCHFHNRHTLCQTTEGSGCCLIFFHQMFQTHTLHIFKGCFCTNHHKGFHGQYVHGIPDTFSDCQRAKETSLPVPR